MKCLVGVECVAGLLIAVLAVVLKVGFVVRVARLKSSMFHVCD